MLIYQAKVVALATWTEEILIGEHPTNKRIQSESEQQLPLRILSQPAKHTKTVNQKAKVTKE